MKYRILPILPLVDRDNDELIIQVKSQNEFVTLDDMFNRGYELISVVPLTIENAVWSGVAIFKVI
jgi:hypothetical protein